jgi:hypothetical protein
VLWRKGNSMVAVSAAGTRGLGVGVVGAPESVHKNRVLHPSDLGRSDRCRALLRPSIGGLERRIGGSV